MARRKLWVVILAAFVVGTLGMGVPSVPAMPADGDEPDLVACAQVIAALIECKVCLMGLWEGCLSCILNLGLGLTAEHIEVCAEYIEKGASKALCEGSGWTWFDGDPPLCIPCGKPGYDCYTFVVGGDGVEEEGHHPEQQECFDMPAWGTGGGDGGGGYYNGGIVGIPNGVVGDCWYIYDKKDGRLIASGCN